LRRVEEGGAFASALLETRGGALDRRDTALLTETVLGVLRRRAILDHAIAAAARRPLGEIQPAVLTALRVGAYALLALDRVPDFAAVDTAVALVKESGHARGAGFVNGVLRTIARAREDFVPPDPAPGDVAALALSGSHPHWWVERVVARLGWDGAAALLAGNNQPAPTVLAVWPPGGTPAELAAALASEGVVVRPGTFALDSLVVEQGVPQHTEIFRAGALWVQDEASQLAVGLLGSRVGPRSLDVCAAPGGKTLALAARTGAGGIVVATDRQPKRLKRLTQNVVRLGASGIVALAADMTREAPFDGSFDDVLVDAPCSGTGTLRRHPEIRWRLRPEDLPQLARRQSLLLERAAALVRPGGRLVYSVCSIEPEEGEQIVDAFLAAGGRFERVDPRPVLSETARAFVGADFALRTNTAGTRMDGFYAAVLTRRSD
jgi:16S rRNA (cytosine967-C5)-methyltransferase